MLKNENEKSPYELGMSFGKYSSGRDDLSTYKQKPKDKINAKTIIDGSFDSFI